MPLAAANGQPPPGTSLPFAGGGDMRFVDTLLEPGFRVGRNPTVRQMVGRYDCDALACSCRAAIFRS
jgi:hypothetical protein